MAIAGSSISLLEAIQHMNQYSTLCVTYRSTTERLKHEKFLFLTAAGPYRGLKEIGALEIQKQMLRLFIQSEQKNEM
jgi:hypothetical protein